MTVFLRILNSNKVLPQDTVPRYIVAQTNPLAKIAQ